jgi:tetratricopeptide (TPR) repeat protein
MGRKPVDPRHYKPEIPVYLARTLMHCLESDPALRYTRIRDVARSLEAKRAERIPFFSFARLRAMRDDRRALIVLLALALVSVSFLGYRFISTSIRKDNVPSAAAVRPVAVRQGSIAVLPFSNRTADPRLDWLRTGLAELMGSDLTETRELRVAAPSETFQLLRDLKLQEAEVQNETTLRQVGRFLNCDLILAGDFGHVGNELAVELKLYRISAGSLIQVASLRRAGNTENVFNLATGLAGEVRKAIQPSLGRDRVAQAPMTQSTEALRSYTNALEHLRQGEYSKAIELLGHAVSHDPNFALAYARQSEAYYRWGRPEDSGRAYEKALSLLEGSQRNQLLESFHIRAQHALLRNDLATVIDLYKQAAAAYPHNIENYLALGDAYESKGELDAAVANYEKAAEIEPNNFRVSLALGRFYILADKYDNAIERLTGALTASTQLNNDQGRADALNAIGIVHQRTQRFDEAERSFFESIAIKKKLGDKRGIAVSLQNLANLNSQRGKPGAAEVKALEARAIFEDLGNRQGIADIAFNLGHIYQDTGRFRDALESFRSALILARELGNPAFLAQLDERIGQIYFLLGRYPDADTYQRQALAERERLGDEEGIIRSLQSIGDVDLEQARFETALERHRAALERGRRLGHAEAAMVSVSQIGLVYQRTGRYRAASESYEEARNGFARLKQQGRSAEIYKRLASLHFEVRDLERARQYIRQATEAAASVQDKALLGEIAMIEGEMALVLEDLESAKQAFARALQSAKESGSAKSVLLAEIHKAGLESRLGGGRRGVALLERLLARAEQMGQVDAVARCYAYLLSSPVARPVAKQTKRWIGRLREYALKGELMRSCFLAAESEIRAGHQSEAKAYAAEGARLLEELLSELDPNQRENLRRAVLAGHTALVSVARP